MNTHSINISPFRLPTPACTLDALRRQSLLASRRALQTELPQAVRDYFNGQRPDDPSVVAQWCCDTGEQAVLGGLQAEGFQGSVVVSRLDEIAWRAAECGFDLKLRLQGEVDSTSAYDLTDLLNTHPLKVTELWLNLSAGISYFPLNGLIRAIDALPDLATLEVRVGGQSEGPVSEHLRWVLASSRTCLTLSAATRSLILDPEMLRPGEVEAYGVVAQALQAEAERLHAEAGRSFLDQGDVQVSSYKVNAYVERMRMRSAGLFDEAAARQLAPAALQAFLSMEKCPDTGDPIKSEFANALARLGCDFGAGPLLRAIHALAPNHVMTWREETPNDKTSMLLKQAGIPCSLQHCIAPSLFTNGASFSHCLGFSGSLFVGLDLKVVEHLDQEETQWLLEDIAQLSAIRDFTFTIVPGISVDITSVDEQPVFSSQADSLVLNGSGSDPNSHETLLLAIFLAGFQPQSLSLGLTTPNGAAALLGLVAEERGAGRLEHLRITCDMAGERHGPSLVNVIKGMLQKPHALENVLIRSLEVLLTGKDETDLFRRQARTNPPTGDIRFEYLSRGWECYFQENLLLSGMAAAFASDHLGLPSDVGAHMVDNIGALSASDISNLRGVSTTMNSAWGRLSRK